MTIKDRLTGIFVMKTTCDKFRITPISKFIKMIIYIASCYNHPFWQTPNIMPNNKQDEHNIKYKTIYIFCGNVVHQFDYNGYLK